MIAALLFALGAFIAGFAAAAILAAAGGKQDARMMLADREIAAQATAEAMKAQQRAIALGALLDHAIERNAARARTANPKRPHICTKKAGAAETIGAPR